MPAFECSRYFGRHALVLRSVLRASGFSLVRRGLRRCFTWRGSFNSPYPWYARAGGGAVHTPSNRRHHPLLNADCVQQHSRGMFWPPTKVLDKYRAVGERELIGVDSKSFAAWNYFIKPRRLGTQCPLRLRWRCWPQPSETCMVSVLRRGAGACCAVGRPRCTRPP